MKNTSLIVGDTEGYYEPFRTLYKVAKKVTDSIGEIIFVGDIVGVGPKNIKLLRYCQENQDKIHMVLGNKDFIVQQLIAGKGNDSRVWVRELARKLEKKRNRELRDFFMNSFLPYYILGNIVITHARPIEGKAVEKHTLKQIIGHTGREKRTKRYIDPQGKLVVHGHHSSEGVHMENRALCLDSGCGKGNELSGLLVGKKQKRARIIDSTGRKQKISLRKSF